MPPEQSPRNRADRPPTGILGALRSALGSLGPDDRSASVRSILAAGPGGHASAAHAAEVRAFAADAVASAP